jgi:hypothetical protein
VSALALSKKSVGPFSRRRHVDGKILRFSILIGVAGAFLTAVAYIGSSYPFVLEARENNLHALSEINCPDATCDTRTFLADWRWTDPDYIVDAQTRFLLDTPSTAQGAGRFRQLDYSNADFLTKFKHHFVQHTKPGSLALVFARGRG